MQFEDEDLDGADGLLEVQDRRQMGLRRRQGSRSSSTRNSTTKVRSSKAIRPRTRADGRSGRLHRQEREVRNQPRNSPAPPGSTTASGWPASRSATSGGSSTRRAGSSSTRSMTKSSPSTPQRDLAESGSATNGASSTRDGALAINTQYDDTPLFGDNGLITVAVGNKYGMIDSPGAFKVNPQFDLAGPFAMGRAFVKIGNLYGYIDETGKVVIGAQFKNARPFDKDNGLAAVLWATNGASSTATANMRSTRSSTPWIGPASRSRVSRLASVRRRRVGSHGVAGEDSAADGLACVSRPFFRFQLMGEKPHLLATAASCDFPRHHVRQFQAVILPNSLRGKSSMRECGLRPARCRRAPVHPVGPLVVRCGAC